MALTASLLVLASIAGLTGLGLSRAMPLVSTASADRQLLDLSIDCKALLASAPRNLADPASPPGATKTIMLSLPSWTNVTFGSSEAGGTIFYEVQGSRKALVLDGVRFSEGVEKGGIMAPSGNYRSILGGGRYELTIEYEYDPSLYEKYLVIY